MAHRLVLIRHAKAEQGSPDLTRHLANRGRGDAGAIGRWLATHDAVPDLVVISPSTRTRETWQGAAAALPAEAPTRIDDRIYDNTVEDLLAVIGECDESVDCLALVGHNPSMHVTAWQLAGDAPLNDAIERFPTSTVAVFDVEGAWTRVGKGDATRLVVVEACRG